MQQSLDPVPIAPVVQEILFPEYQQVELSNGIVVYYVEDATLSLFRLRLVSRSGADQERIPGQARLTMSVLPKGTTARSAQQIAEEIEFMGATIGTSAGWDMCAVSLTVLPEFGQAALAVFADVVLNPTFPANEVERLRKQHQAALQQLKFDPSYQAKIALIRTVYQNHQYARSLNGTLQSLEEIDSYQCAQFYHQTFHPTNVFFVAAGPYPVAVIQQLLEQFFGQWKAADSTVDTTSLEVAYFPTTACLGIVDNPEAVQAEIRLALSAPSYEDSLYPAFLLANTVLSGSFVSRLNRILREEKGYTYGIGGSMVHRRWSHLLVIRAGIGNEVLSSAVRDWLAELRRFGNEPLDSVEVELARRYLLGQMAMQLESVSAILGLLATQELYQLPRDFYPNLYQQVRALTNRQLQYVQARFFRNPVIAVGAAGKAELIQQAFQILTPLAVHRYTMNSIVEDE